MSNTLTPSQIKLGNENNINIGDEAIILGYPEKIQATIVAINDELVFNSLTGFRETLKVAEARWDLGTSYIWLGNLQKKQHGP